MMEQQKLYMDTRPGSQPKGTYPYGKNGIQNELLDSVFNEPGFAQMAAVVPYTLMGVIETDNRPILFSTDDTNSAIGYFNHATGAYQDIIKDDPGALINWPATGERLGFKRTNYITGQAQRNYKGETICAFTDKTLFPKYVNCDNPVINRLDDIRLFPINIPPVISMVESFGGTLEAGTYYAVINYEKYDGAATQRSEVSPGVTVAPGDFNTTTDKSLLITVNNVDLDYNFIRLSILSRIKGVTKAVEVSELIPITSTTQTILYTGENLSVDISVSEILTPPATYTKVGTMGQLNDALYLGGLHKDPDINDMQPYANLVTLQWKSELMDCLSPLPEHVAGIKKSFMHEEIYAVYIRYRKTRGGFTKAYIIPGLAPTGTDTNASSAATLGGGSAKNFQVDDTIHSFNAGTFSGVPGIWQNDVETYPNIADFNSTSLGGRDLRGAKVLHHKMPSIRWCKTNLYSGVDEYGRTKLDLLGLTPANVTIPSKYIGIIDGYQILYAKRTVSNQTIYGQSLLMHGAVDVPSIGSTLGVADIYTTGGNWTASVWHNGKGDYNDDWELQELRRDTLRFHSFDMLFNKPSIAPTFVSAQLKTRRENLRIEGYLEDGSIDSGGGPIVHLVDYTNGVTPAVPTSGQHLRKVLSSFYMQNGISVGKFINANHEAAYGGTLGGDSGLFPLTYGDSGIRIRGQSYTEPDVGSPDFEESYLVNLVSVKQDLYATFYSQHLVSAGDSMDLSTFNTVWGGDTFLCPYTFHTYGRHDIQDTAGADIQGIKVIRRFVCESASNIHLRYEIAGNEYSQWFPHTAVSGNGPTECYITNFMRSKEPNQFGYTRDLGALNDFISSTIFNPYLEELLDFPYRIHRTGKLSRQTRPRNWRTALPLDYYECQKNMGFIVNLDSMNDRLIIHHENAVFMTQDKAKLDAGVLNITLGTGDIFQFEPQEVEAAKLGMGGTQHDLACIKTPIGYVFVDAKQGEVYMINKQTEQFPIVTGLLHSMKERTYS